MKKIKKMPDGGPISPQDQSVRDWYSSYINSPKYKERLSNFYQYPSYIQGQRSNELMSTTFDNRTTSPTRYYSDDNSININPGQLKSYNIGRSEGVAHELSHSTNAGIDPALHLNDTESAFILNRNKTLPSGNAQELLSSAKDSKQTVSNLLQGQNHDVAPSESKSDIDAFRYLLNQRKIYNAGTQDINQQVLDKASKDSQIKDSFIYKRLKNNFNDKSLLEIMNKVATNKHIPSGMAAYGANIPDFQPIYGYESMPGIGDFNPTEYMSEAESGIHINPANKGKFNALKKRTGKSTEELTHSKNPLTRKRAVFAQNASHWNHAEYGDQLSQADNSVASYFKKNRGQISNNASQNGNDQRLVDPNDNSLYDEGDSDSLSSIGSGINTGLGIHLNLGELATGLGSLVGNAVQKSDATNAYATQLRRNAQLPIYTPHPYGTGAQALYNYGGNIPKTFANGGIVPGSTHYMSDSQIRQLQAQGYDLEFLD